MSEGFARRLKAEREAASYNQSELAREFGLSPTAIFNYEKNNREPDFDTLIKISDFFGVSADYMLGHTDYPCTPDAILKGQDREQKEVLELMTRTIDEWEELFKYISRLSQRLNDSEKVQFMDFVKSFGETWLKRKQEEIKKPGE